MLSSVSCVPGLSKLYPSWALIMEPIVSVRLSEVYKHLFLPRKIWRSEDRTSFRARRQLLSFRCRCRWSSDVAIMVSSSSFRSRSRCFHVRSDTCVTILTVEKLFPFLGSEPSWGRYYIEHKGEKSIFLFVHLYVSASVLIYVCTYPLCIYEALVCAGQSQHLKGWADRGIDKGTEK